MLYSFIKFKITNSRDSSENLFLFIGPSRSISIRIKKAIPPSDKCIILLKYPDWIPESFFEES